MKSSILKKKLLRSRKDWSVKSQIDFLMKNIPDQFHIVDFNGYILDVNTAFERVYGWKKKEIMHKYIPLVPPRLSKEFFSFLARIKQDESVSSYKTTRIRKDRSEISVSIDAFILKDRRGYPTAVGEISRNISEPRLKETIAKRFQERWKSLTHNTSHLIITVDRQERITFINQRIKQLLGYDVGELMNSPLSKLIVEEDLGTVKKDILEVITKNRRKYCVSRLKRKDGSSLTCGFDWSPLREPSVKIEGAVGIGRDITQEKELIQSQRLQALADFVGGIAHHFNNLMTIILLQSQLIEGTEKAEDDAISRGLKIINETCFRGKKQIEQILEFTEGLSSKESLMVDIDQIIKDALDEILVQIKTKDIQVNTKWGNIPSIPGCSSQMRKAFMEILINAVESMPQKGKLEIKTSVINNSAYISIVDSGIGMSEEVQRKMFEPFFTTKESTRNGLGATLAYEILKKYGGKIKVLSAPERGTTLVIRLPIKKDV
jgi:PAS domain S-box-containing protein